MVPLHHLSRAISGGEYEVMSCGGAESTIALSLWKYHFDTLIVAEQEHTLSVEFVRKWLQSQMEDADEGVLEVFSGVVVLINTFGDVDKTQQMLNYSAHESALVHSIIDAVSKAAAALMRLYPSCSEPFTSSVTLWRSVYTDDYNYEKILGSYVFRFTSWTTSTAVALKHRNTMNRGTNTCCLFRIQVGISNASRFVNINRILPMNINPFIEEDEWLLRPSSFQVTGIQCGPADRLIAQRGYMSEQYSSRGCEISVVDVQLTSQ